MARRKRDRDLVQTHKRLRRDLWVGWKPNGMGEQKPNHYRDIGKVDLGEPAQPAVRVADPEQGRLRRVRARGRGLPRLDDQRRPPLHDPPRAAEGQHRDRAARRRARRREGARRARRPRAARARPARASDGAQPRRSRLPARLVGRPRSISSPTGSGARVRTASASTSRRAASRTRCTTRRRRRRASSARTTSTTRRASVTRRRRTR